MSFDPNLEEQEVLAETFDRQAQRMSPRERIGEALAGAGFVGATAGLVAIQPPHGFAPWPALLCLSVLVAAMLIRIDTRFGFTSPTQLAFVPLVFTMPPALVPVAVAVAAAISMLPLIVRGEMPPTKLTVAITNSWFAVGPVSVFVVAGVSPRSAGPLLLIGALVAQCAFDAATFALRMAISRRAKPSELAVPWVYVIDGALSGVGLVVAKAVASHPAAVLALLPLLAIFAMFARERHQRLVSLIELNSAYRGTALVLGDVVEADDGYTAEHCKSVVDLAMAVANSMGLDAARRRNLEFAALLHDVGKIAIPNDIINKPGKLDVEEWAVMKTHTIEGQRMLDRVGGFMREVGLIVRSHHERWDGGGYPDGLAGAEIPLEARIIACCDAWNAMRTDRSYRKALSHEVAMAELAGNVGRQFDPGVAAAIIPIVAAEADAGSQPARDAHPAPPAHAYPAPVAEPATR
jgi:putative nucleotidyltransferase with HDIG domain